jgi:hypothetical protein
VSVRLDAYLELERTMRELDDAGDSMADLRDALDPIWYGLTDEDRAFLNRRSIRDDGMAPAMSEPYDITQCVIRSGAHDAPESIADPITIEACAGEHAYLRNALRNGWSLKRICKHWSANLECASPVMNCSYIAMNDHIRDDARRSRVLGQVVDLLPGSKGSPEVEKHRRLASADWLFRFAAPMALRQTSLAHLAEDLASLPEIVDDETFRAATAAIGRVREECRNARWHSTAAAAAAAAAADVAAADAAAETVDAAAEDAAAAAAAAAATAVTAAEAATAYAAANAVAVAIANAIASAYSATYFEAATQAEELPRIGLAAKQARENGGDYDICYQAARQVADEVFAKYMPTKLLTSVRDELDAGWVALQHRLAGMR